VLYAQLKHEESIIGNLNIYIIVPEFLNPQSDQTPKNHFCCFLAFLVKTISKFSNFDNNLIIIEFVKEYDKLGGVNWEGGRFYTLRCNIPTPFSLEE
jgi:hypothetical protein